MELKLPPPPPTAAEPGEDAARGFRAGSEDRVTPMMAQYLEIKAGHPDGLLFYRMGDFYELFFQDAEIASRALGIVLTKRGKHNGADIPMCGVPVVRSDEYLHKLIAAGFLASCQHGANAGAVHGDGLLGKDMLAGSDGGTDMGRPEMRR